MSATASSAPPSRPAASRRPGLGREAGGQKDSPFGNIGGGGKEPIKIDADRLDVFDRENKAVFAGNVVAVQGDSTIRCSTMTVTYKRGKDGPGQRYQSRGEGRRMRSPAPPGTRPRTASRRWIAPAR